MSNDEQAASSLASVLTALSENPVSEHLHYRALALSQAAGVSDAELEVSRETLVSLFPTTDAVWLPLLAAKVAKVSSGDLTAEEVDTTFQQAEEDYYSIPIQRAHLAFLTQGNLSPTEDSDDADDFFSTPNVQEKASLLLAKAAAHVTEGYLLWNDWLEWWTNVIGKSSGNEREEHLQLLKLEFLKRLSQPHSTNDETFQAYSTFVSNYLPPAEYENTLVHATKIRQPALAAWRNRERYQLGLNSPQAYNAHLQAERRKRAKSTDPRLRDPSAIINIFERAIAFVASARVETLSNTDSEQLASSDLATTDAWLSAFWVSYVDFLQSDEVDMPELELGVLSRASRSVPADGDIWVTYLRALETHGQDDLIIDVYQNAIMRGQLSAKTVADVSIAAVVPTYRLLRSGFDADIFSGIIELLEEAVRRCRDAGGDSRLKLEQFLVQVLLHPTGEAPAEYPKESIAAAIAVWEPAVKHYKKHWHVWSSYMEFLINVAKDFPRVRKAFREFSGSHLSVDYPEALYEAWIVFEEKWGTKEQLADALARVKKLNGALAEKRAKDAARAARMQGAVDTILGEVSSTAPQPTPGQIVDVEMTEATASTSSNHVPTPATGERTSTKRKAADVDAEDGPSRVAAKKAKPEAPAAAAKRDREKSTVFVSGIPTDAGEVDIQQLFKDCGEIREVKISAVENDHIATVEFQDKESVLAALTKDKKHVRNDEVSVYQAWQCTLYITNFPEKYDDDRIRNLFGKYGAIFEVRWPSKKFKSTRRFCYLQYTTPASAQAALELNNFKLADDYPLSVAISNPERKKDRTDADADQREIHVGGLNRNVGKKDLEGLFAQYGAVKEVRLALDDAGKSKGFAFVEFENTLTAMSALAANNTDLKGRRIAVTLADRRVPAKKTPTTSGLGRSADAASRSVHIEGLPDLTPEQEPLLQQALEKLVEKVVFLSVLNEKHEATAELASQAEASKLVLLQSMSFQDRTLTFSEEIQQNASKRSSRKAPAPASAAATASKPKKKGRVTFADADAMDEDPKEASTAELSTTSAPAESSAAPFVPRIASRGGRGGRPRAGLGASSRTTRSQGAAAAASSTSDVAGSTAAASSGAKGQDDFRKMLNGGS